MVLAVAIARWANQTHFRSQIVRKILDELDPFFFMAALVIGGMTVIQSADISYRPPTADFAQAMTEPVETEH